MIELNQRGVDNLIVAIVWLAMLDYKRYRIKEEYHNLNILPPKCKHDPFGDCDIWEIQNLKSFFESEWFQVLCPNIKPRLLFEKMEEDIAAELSGQLKRRKTKIPID